MKDGDRYEVLTAGGPTGVVVSGVPLDSPFVLSSGTITPYTTITLAIAAAGAGDTVYVPPGTYTEDITLKNGVTVYGLGPRDDIIISGDEDIVTTASGGYLENVTILATDPPVAGNRAAIEINHASGVCVFRNVLLDLNNTNACNLYGVLVDAALAGGLTVFDGLEIDGDASGANAAVSGIGITVAGSHIITVQNFNIETDSAASGAYGLVVSAAGDIYGYHGRIDATGATASYDLYQSAGTLSVYSIAFDPSNIFGTITHLSGDRTGYNRQETITADWTHNANVIMGDDYYLGLGAAKGRMIFDDDPNFTSEDLIHVDDAILSLKDNFWLMGEEVLNLDFTGTDFDTKAECNAVGLRFSDSDTPFTSNLVYPVSGTWAHNAGSGWEPGAPVNDEGPALLVPLCRSPNWEFELVFDFTPTNVNQMGFLYMGYITNSNHVGAFSILYDVSAVASQLTAVLATNDGDDTWTNRHVGVVLAGAGDRTLGVRCQNGAVSIYDPQAAAWQDYTGRQNAGIAYNAAHAFIQFRKSGANPFWVDVNIKSLTLTYLL
jgi:hypothetical protein